MEGLIHLLFSDRLLLSVGANYLFDWLLLWATASATKCRTTRLRLIAGALLGTFHYGLYLLATYGLVGGYAVLRFPGTVGLISLAMLCIAFLQEITAVTLLRLTGTFYVILFVSAGAGIAVGGLLTYGGTPHPLLIQMAAIGALLLVAEMGWGVMQKRIWRSQSLVSVEIHCERRRVELTALVDTGNQLQDPLTRAPVIVVELNALQDLFPEPLREDIAELVRGDLSRVSPLSAHGTWSARIRLIPFSSLGAQNGLLVGFKPDQVRITLPRSVLSERNAIIGLTPQVLDRNGEYRALLHPALLTQQPQTYEQWFGDIEQRTKTVSLHSN